MKYSAASIQTGTKTTLRGPTIVVGTSGMILWEVGVASTVATESHVQLRKFTAAGAAGTAIDDVPWGDGAASTFAASQVPSADHTPVAGFIRSDYLPAAIGGGIIWTFGPKGMYIPGGTGDGFYIALGSGTDRVVSFYFDVEE